MEVDVDDSRFPWTSRYHRRNGSDQATNSMTQSAQRIFTFASLRGTR